MIYYHTYKPLVLGMKKLVKLRVIAPKTMQVGVKQFTFGDILRKINVITCDVGSETDR